MVFGLISLGLCGAPFSIGLKQLFVIISTSVGVFFKFNLIFLIHRFDCKMIKYPDYIVLKPWVMSPYFVKLSIQNPKILGSQRYREQSLIITSQTLELDSV